MKRNRSPFVAGAALPAPSPRPVHRALARAGLCAAILALSPMVLAAQSSPEVLARDRFASVAQAGGGGRESGLNDPAKVGVLSRTRPKTLLTVTTTADDGSAGSLRSALEYVDSNCYGYGPFTVGFSVAGTIQVSPELGPFPQVNCYGTVIDGTTAPGYAANTRTDLGGSDAVPAVFLDGSQLQLVESPADGLSFDFFGSDMVVKGLAIGNFSGAGIRMDSYGGQVLGNFIGVAPDGGAAPNGIGLVMGNSGFVGGIDPSERNVISGNTQFGISGGSYGAIRNNLIGLAPDGSALGNGLASDPGTGDGINVDISFSVAIGGTEAGEPNRIAYNARHGISAAVEAGDIHIRGNQIFANGSLGIDRAETLAHGVSSVVYAPGLTTLTWAGSGFFANMPVAVEFFDNADPLLGLDQGQRKVDSCSALTDGSGAATCSAGTTQAVRNLTATVTFENVETGGDTSEFSAPLLTPEAEVSPSGTVTFDPAAVGGSGTSRTVTITNAGQGTMTITAITSSAPSEFTDVTSLSPPWCGLGPTGTGQVQLEPAASCTLDMRFTPQDSGVRTATITVETGNTVFGGNPVIALSGTGTTSDIGAQWSFNPASVVTGTPSTLTLGVSNANAATLSGGAGTVTLPASLVVAGTPNATVGSPCTGSIAATPGASNYAVSALSIPSGSNCNLSLDVVSIVAANYPMSSVAGLISGNVLLASVGTAASNVATLAVVNPASLSVAPLSVTFPGTVIGVESDPVSVTVSNAGGTPLTLSGPIVATGNFLVNASGCPVSPSALAPLGSCSLSVTFLPQMSGVQTGSIPITSDAGSALVSLSGTGTFTMPAVTWTFNPLSVFAGNPATLHLLIANANGAPFTSSGFTQNLPSGLVVASAPNASNPASPCAGTVASASPGGSSFSVTGLSVPTSGSCAFALDVTSATPATYPVSMPAGTIVGSILSQANVTNASSNTASLVVTAVPAPVLSISPAPPGPLDFGNVTVGTASAYQTVTLVNAGNAPLAFSGSPVVTGPFAGNLATASPCPASLPASPGPGNSCTVEVKFAPTAVGAATGSIAFASDGGSGSLQLAGIGDPVLAPAVNLAPTSLAFPTQTVGTTSSPMPVTLTNAGTAPLAIAAIETSGDFAQSSTCPIAPSTLAAGNECGIAVTFTPVITGGRVGSVTIASDADGSPHSVSLSGTGAPVPVPALSATPDAIAFPQTQVGTTSEPSMLVVKNVGGAPLAITAIEIVGSGFGLASNGCITTLAAGADCLVGLVFAPAVTGTTAATLRIISNAPASPTFVGLSGTGTAAPVATLAASPGSLAFGELVTGTTSPPQSITLGNTGGSAASVSSIDVAGDYAQTNNCAAVAAGGSCTITVTFTPSAVGERPGSITVVGNASNLPLVIPLSGGGSPVPFPVVGLSVSSLGFGNRVINGPPLQQSVTLVNSGGAPLTIARIEVAGEFSYSNGCPTVVPAGGICRIDVTFVPGIPGPRFGRLDVFSNANNGTQGVDLGGTGCRFSFLNRSLTLLCQ